MKPLLFVLFTCLLFCSCASTYQTEKFSSGSNEDQARLIVLRPSILGVINTANIYQNESFVGKVSKGGYIAWNVKPGSVIVRSSKGYYKINAISGKTYYLKLVPKVSYSLSDANYEFELLDNNVGEKKIAQLAKPKIKAT